MRGIQKKVGVEDQSVTWILPVWGEIYNPIPIKSRTYRIIPRVIGVRLKGEHLHRKTFCQILKYWFFYLSDWCKI